MRSLRDKVAVVTGAASGIGRALAGRLAREGCALALVDVDAVGLAATAAALSGVRVSTHGTDVSDRSAMVALAEAVIAAHGGVDLLFNNAGVQSTALFRDHDLDDFEWVIGVDLMGVVYGCHVFLPHLLARPEAHIVNVSSVFGIMAPPLMSSYSAAKYGVRGFTEVLWEELRGTGVGVSLVHPGGVNTGIVRRGRDHDADRAVRFQRAFDRFAMAPDRAADIIVDGVLADRPRILIGAEARVIDFLKRSAPILGNRLLSAVGLRLLDRR